MRWRKKHVVSALLRSRWLIVTSEYEPQSDLNAEASNIDSPKIKAVPNHLKQTGILSTEGGHLENQLSLMPVNKEDNNGGYYD
jgi:hypothetical protein